MIAFTRVIIGCGFSFLVVVLRAAGRVELTAVRPLRLKFLGRLQRTVCAPKMMDFYAADAAFTDPQDRKATEFHAST